MPKQSKRLSALKAQVDRNHRYTPTEAFTSVKEMASANFDESIDVAVRLGVTVMLIKWFVVRPLMPHGTGKGVKVIVFAEGDAANVATDAELTLLDLMI